MRGIDMYHYSSVEREQDTYALPDIEIFEVRETDSNADIWEPGFYYWYCFPGCLPDSDPFGPYATENEALEAAKEYC
jgi:hypothetical protein